MSGFGFAFAFGICVYDWLGWEDLCVSLYCECSCHVGGVIPFHSILFCSVVTVDVVDVIYAEVRIGVVHEGQVGLSYKMLIASSLAWSTDSCRFS